MMRDSRETIVATANEGKSMGSAWMHLRDGLELSKRIPPSAQHLNSTRPRPWKERSDTSIADSAGIASQGNRSFAQSEWKRLRQITRRAHDDDTSDTTGEVDMTDPELLEYRHKKADAKRDREKRAKIMGLEYFLELVDNYHRYGSHLRAYHAVWMSTDIHENFFYWLDEGEGRHIDAPTCSRHELDRDQVRYLSKEQRQHYLVRADKKGRLHWDKNDDLINTSNAYKDSLQGIVWHSDPTPSYREEARLPTKNPPTANGTAASDLSDEEEEGKEEEEEEEEEEQEEEEGEGEEGKEEDANSDLGRARSAEKVQYPPAAALLNHLLQSRTKKNTWIFVADTSFRLYIGIKQPGAFQHSSFMHGARISAAGMIKVKDGQIRSLSPLSGHYRPPTSNFRRFIRVLRDHGVDLSRVSLGRSYAILIGLEGYMSTKGRTKSSMNELERQMERILRPKEAKKKAEEARDKSMSAQKEREWLQREKDAKKAGGWRATVDRKPGDDTNT